jgi:hypothetical protein
MSLTELDRGPARDPHTMADPTDSPRPAVPSTPAEPEPSRLFADVVARLQARYPSAPTTLVQRCVEDALSRLRDAPIQLYVHILVERRARETLVEALVLDDQEE